MLNSVWVRQRIMDYGVVNLTPLTGLFLTNKPEYYTKHKKISILP